MKGVVVAIALLAPGAAAAQAAHCDLPAQIERPHPELPSADQPQRLLPIGGYTLAITWSPEYCHGHARDRSAQFECGSGHHFGFTLHGLWPDGVGREWPQYCRSTPLLPAPVIAAHLCATPSAQLLQHEWAKHGTCLAGYTPARYFDRSTALYRRLRFPDMDALSRRRLTVADFAGALAAANPGIPAAAIRITGNRQGWLEEIWFCLDRAFAYTRCRADSGGLPGNATLKIGRSGGD